MTLFSIVSIFLYFQIFPISGSAVVYSFNLFYFFLGNGLLAWLTVRYPQELPAIFIGSVVRMEFTAYFGRLTVLTDGGKQGNEALHKHEHSLQPIGRCLLLIGYLEPMCRRL